MTMIIVGGATATGKTQLAKDICEKIGGEIVSADSMQIYKGMDIGTAKEKSEALGVPIHCIDICSPFDAFTVVDYKEFAKKDIIDIENRGKVPVICGGTGFYINSLVYNYSYGGSGYNEDEYESLMINLKNKHEKLGASALHQELAAMDPKSAEMIHQNNTKRMLRALAVSILTGKPFSKQDENIKEIARKDIKMFVIDYEDRSILRERIKKRVEIMMQNGLETEVKKLFDEGLSFDAQSMQAIGYKEWKGRFLYEEAPKNIDSIAMEIIKNTSAYAKRQGTWFRNQYDISVVIKGEETPEERLEKVLRVL